MIEEPQEVEEEEEEETEELGVELVHKTF
jgi:hypothetical protein